MKLDSPKRILVTGGLGYIGYHVVSKLLKETEHEVVVLDSGLYQDDTLGEFQPSARLTVIKGDIRNISDIVKAIQNVDAVIALAAIVGDPACALNESETLSSNYHSTELMVSMCNYYKVKRLIFASSCSVYGAGDIILNEGSKLHPLSLYAQTRVMSEEVIRKSARAELSWTILRFGTVFGWSKRMRFDLVVNFLITKALKEGVIEIVGGNQWRPLVHVRDVAKAVFLAALADHNLVDGEVFNVGDNKQNFQIMEVAAKVKKILPGVKIVDRQIPDKDRRNYQVSFDKIRDTLGFKAQYSLKKGMKEILNELERTKIDYLDDRYYNVKYLFKNGMKE